MELSAKPLSKNTWQDFEKLFGEKGACGGCWCMHWRLTNRQYEKMKGLKNKLGMNELVAEGSQIGIMAYTGGEPIGWCSVSPREVFTRLQNSRVLARVDQKTVWSLVCFFIKKEFRYKGLSKFLIQQGVQYAVSHGASIVEAYPIIPKKKNVPPVFAFTGFASAFRTCGFKEVVRRSETRPIMRWEKP